MNNIITTKRLLLMVFIFAFPGSVLAQQKDNNFNNHHHISMHTCGFHATPNHYSFFDTKNSKPIASMIGLEYQYSFSKRLSGYINFSFNTLKPWWPDILSTGTILSSNTKRYWESDNEHMHYYPDGSPKRYYNPGGFLIFREDYYFFDAGANYAYFLNSRNKISVHLGLSYTTGLNDYLTQIFFAPRPYYDGHFIKHIEKRTSYWGAVAGLAYDYYFWQGRLNAGVNINVRYYEKDMPSIIDYGFHLGYNF